LGLDAGDINILLHLARYWWYRDNPPHPAKRTIAECMGVHPSTVRRRIAKMEAVGFIRRENRFDKISGRQETNLYHFAGLIKHATPFALEAIEERERRRADSAARHKRKKPRLAADDNPSGREDKR